MKTTVHNELEARALVKEQPEKYDGFDFYTHDGQYIFSVKIIDSLALDMTFASYYKKKEIA